MRKRVFDHIRDRLLEPVKALEQTRRVPPLDELRAIQSHRPVWDLCDNRMLLGGFRYELNTEKERRGTAGYAVVNDAVRRIRLYEQDGNREHLLDAINMLAIEFRWPEHPHATFEAVDDGQHARPTVHVSN